MLLAAAVVLLVLPGSGSAATGDYLSPDLRARVDKLKADAAYLPTGPINIEERARVLGQWANAYALDGGQLPVNLTAAISSVFVYPDLAANQLSAIDAFIFEMTLLDEQPDAIGPLVADPGPFEARAFVTIRQTYTVGTRPVQTGGGFVVARHFMPNYGVWQATDPGADNYLTIVSSNPGVAFEADVVQMSGMHGGFRREAPTLMFRLTTGTLEPGDQVTLVYGDTSRGSRGFLMADFSSDRMPLPLYLAFAPDEPFITLPIAPIRVTGTEIASVHGFAPSVVRPGEPFTLSVRGEDRYFNRSRNGHPSLEVRNGAAVLAEVPSSSQAISLVQNLVLSEPGVYHLTIANDDGAVFGTVNPILVTTSPANRIYWGDTHGHSGFAEGIGTPERFMIWARDDARLDFVTHSEHDIWLDDREWEVLRDNVSRFTEDHRFIAYLGYEWTVSNVSGGHHNVLFRTPEGRNRIAGQQFPTLSRLYAGLRQAADPADVVVIPHAHQAGDYRQNDPELEPLVEIMSQHGNFEWFGRMYLNHGHQVGFTAASDNHLSQPGYTVANNGSLAQRGGLGAILATEKTRDAIFDAMKSLKAYATTGDRIILDVTLNGGSMGSRVPFDRERRIEGRVIGTAPIESVTIVRNDQTVWSQDYLTLADNQLKSEETLLLSFASEATPINPGDNPRGWRHWRGELVVSNADLVTATGMDFHNHVWQSVEVDPEDPNRVRFTTLTRGDTSSIALKLNSARRATSIRLQLEEARESGGAPPRYRSPALVPAAEVTLMLRDLVDGRLSREVPAPDYTDTIVLRRQITDGPREVSFSFDDTGERQGDYYFVRVRQANDAMAWSSPIWVGGHPKR
jgi:hypothetical protein